MDADGCGSNLEEELRLYMESGEERITPENITQWAFLSGASAALLLIAKMYINGGANVTDALQNVGRQLGRLSKAQKRKDQEAEELKVHDQN